MRAFPAALAILCACQSDPPATGPAAMRAAGPARPRREPRGPEHPVYSLADNRLYAHVERDGGLVVVPGSPGFAKYLRFGRPRVGWTGALADTYAAVSIPVTEEQAAARRIWVRLSSPAPRRMTVMVNGKNAQTVALAAGAQTVAAAVPPGLLRAGENDVQLAFEAGAFAKATVAEIQVGGPRPPDESPVVWDPARRALRLERGTALVYYVAVPAGARVAADVSPGCRVEVSARAADGARASGALEGEAAAVELAALAGQVARLRLAAVDCAEARLTSAALVIPGAPPAPLKRARRPSHVVLWIMDSLRADKLRPFAPAARPEAPAFQALAARGTLFTSAWAQGNESRASHASIWTGLYPANHRMIEPGVALDPRWVTLGTAMKSAGLQTSGATANGYVTERWGFGAGWDHFRNNIHDEGSTRGDEILKIGIDSLAAEPRSPWFLYLGTVDTHVSWRGKEPWLGRYDPRPYDGPFETEALGRDVELIAAGKRAVTERDQTHIIALYDSNVSFQDQLLGRLVAQLDEWGIADDTLLVVTADHGDELWEDGRVGHGGSLHETLVHVPLLAVYPPAFPPGTVAEEVELVDVLPTLVDALGLSAPEDAQGASLVPLAQGVGRGYPRGAVASQFESAFALRLFGWKARVGASGVPALYHLDDDPLERKDLAAARPLERRFVTDVLSTFLLHQKEWRKSRWGAVANVSSQMADDLER
jgi:arylsulfatase A-like enzyme